MNTFVSWLKSWTNDGQWALALFPILTIILLWSSLKIVKYAEVLIAKTRLGGGFVGATLIATITSAPELITEITQALGGNPENGLGDDIGSNAFSLFLIGVAGIIAFRQMFLNKLAPWTKISIIISFFATATLSIILIFNQDIKMGTIGIIPISFFLFYLLTLYLTYKFDREGDNDDEFAHLKHISLTRGILFFVLFGLIVIFFSVLINIDVKAFQDGFNIDTKSIGGVFLAITTSLPEVVAFFSFLRKKHTAAAIGSLIGSHFFNLGIMFFGDLSYTNGPTMNKATMNEHYPLAIIATIMIGLIIAHFTLAKRYKVLFMKKSVYLIIPSLITVGYIVGWAMLLSFH